MSVLSALMLKIGADSSGLRKELKGTKKQINNAFSVDPIVSFQNAITGTTANVGFLINKFNAATALVGGGFGLTALITNAVNAGAATKDLADKLQISTAEAGKFSRVIKLTGGDVDTASAAIMRLDSSISGNSEKAQKIRAVLDTVGVSITNQEGKLLPLNEQIKNLARGYQVAAQAGYGQEYIMNTLGVRGMALTETLLKYNEAAEDASKIKGIGLDVKKMAEIDRELKVVQAQIGQLTMAGGALLAPIVGEYLPAITEGLAETAGLIAENKEEIVSFGTGLAQLVVTYKLIQAMAKTGILKGSIVAAAAELNALTKAQEAAVSRRLSILRAAQKKEEQMMVKEVAARKITEAEKEKAITESCIRIQMKYAKTAAQIEAEMRAAYRKMNAEANLSAAGQVHAIATTGTAAQVAGAKAVVASGAAKGAVISLTKSVWALVGGWYAVAAAIAFAFEKLVEFKQQQAQQQGLVGGDIYTIDGQQYRRAEDGKYYRREINMDAEDAFDTYTETQVLEDDELAILKAAYERKHPKVPSKDETGDKDIDIEKIKKVFSNTGGTSGAGGKGSSRANADPEKEEREHRQKLQRSIEQEYSMRKTVNDAMRESINLQTAYMTAAQKAAYEMQKEHEKAVEEIKSRWLQFEMEYIGMSDSDRTRMIKNLEKVGAAYEITEGNRLSLAKQVAKDIAAAEKQYEDEIMVYHTQCKDILAEIDEAYRLNSVEKLQKALTDENAIILNAYNIKQNLMKRYYDNWLITHRNTSEMVGNVVMDSQSTFENFFQNVLTGTKSFNDSFLDLLSGLLDSIVKQIAEMMAAKVVNQFLNWISPSFGFGFGGAVKSGGFDTYGAAGRAMGISIGSYSPGGSVYGPGSGTSDSIPAMLSNGEFVMRAEAVRRIGVPYLNHLNKGYANGGFVTNSAASGRFGGPANIQINIRNETGQQLEAKEAGSRFDGEKYVLNLILKFVNNNDGGLRTMIKGVATT